MADDKVNPNRDDKGQDKGKTQITGGVIKKTRSQKLIPQIPVNLQNL
jgi:hypothetical protein